MRSWRKKTKLISKLDVSNFATYVFVKTQTNPIFEFDPLQSLKDYNNFDESEHSIDSKISFKFHPVEKHSLATSIREIGQQKLGKGTQNIEEGAINPEAAK